MVTPNWEMFSKPNTIQEEEQDQQQNEIQEFEQELPGKELDEEKPFEEKPQWGNFQTPTTFQGEEDPTEDESTFEYIARNAVGLTSRLFEQGVGRWGNLEKFGKDVLVNFPKSAGPIGWAISELLGPEKWESIVRGSERKQILPTSQQLRESTKKISGGYTEPKTSGEEKIHEFVEDVGSSARRSQNAFQTAANTLLIPAAANVAKNITKDLGFGDNKANLTKSLVWLPLTLAANINAPRYASQLMNQGRNGYNPNVVANVQRYQQGINNASRNMLAGDPRSNLARQQIVGIENDIANGQTSIRDLMNRYDAISAAKRDRGLFELGRADRAAATRNINQVQREVRNEIEVLGQSNPQALESWRNGLQSWAVIHQSNSIRNWIESVAKGPYSKLLSGPAAALFGVGSYGVSKLSAMVSLPTTAAVSASYKTGQTIYRMWNSPTLNNYYWNAIGSATSENLPAFINNYNKLNKSLEKESKSSNKKNKQKTNKKQTE